MHDYIFSYEVYWMWPVTMIDDTLTEIGFVLHVRYVRILVLENKKIGVCVLHTHRERERERESDRERYLSWENKTPHKIRKGERRNEQKYNGM